MLGGDEQQWACLKKFSAWAVPVPWCSSSWWFCPSPKSCKKNFLEKVHAKRSFGQSLLPDNTIVIVSLTNLHLLISSTSYLAQSAWFQTWLSNYLFNSSDNSSVSWNGTERQSSGLKNYVSGQVFNCKELPLLADVIRINPLFLKSSKQAKILLQVLQPCDIFFLSPADATWPLSKNTEHIQSLDYPLGLKEGELTLRLLIKYLTLIMDKVSAYLTRQLSSSLAYRNIPTQTSIEVGFKLAARKGWTFGSYQTSKCHQV